MEPAIYLGLELPSDYFKLSNAELFLSQHPDRLIVIDEVQINKTLFPIIRALLDKTRNPGQFFLLGLATPELIGNSSESLAGRIAYHRLFPFHLIELPNDFNQNQLWFRGGFPDSLFAPDNDIRVKWMLNFVNTYLNRDLLMLGLNAPNKGQRLIW